MTRHAKRILFVTESFGIGGTETHLLELLPSLKARGFAVAAFCFTDKGSRVGRLDAENIPVSAAPDLGNRRKRSWRAPVRMVGGAARLLALIWRFRPSIIHFFLPAPYILGAPVAILAGVPIKLMSRRSLNDYQKNWPGSAYTERRLHGRMDALLGNAVAITQELISEGAPEAKVHLIYNGVRLQTEDVDKRDVRASLGIEDGAFVAIVVANLHPYKGHLDLIAGLTEIADRLPNPWNIIMVGRDHGSLADIKQATIRAGIESRVLMLGERSDIPQLLKAADIGVLTPTGNEGFSNAILESMAAGLPMVVTDVGGNAEAVLDGETGRVVPAHDPKAIGAAILELASDPERRKAMGKAARRRAAEHFSLTTQLDKYCTLYEDLLAHT